ncbi:MAG: sugar ABC transporter permease [Armatimonadetes bacterium]|nr:sugar ABC transporter permease [Anaerolineae bacterium]
MSKPHWTPPKPKSTRCWQNIAKLSVTCPAFPKHQEGRGFHIGATRVQTATSAHRKPLLTRLLPYLLVAPTLLLILTFTLLPAVQSIIDSLYRPAREVNVAPSFVGLQNYLDLFDPVHYIGSRFVTVLGNTVIFAVATTVFTVPLALLFAMLLNRRVRWLGLWRFSLFYPALLPLIGAASIWAFLLADPLGIINTVLRSLGATPVGWLNNPGWVLIAVIAVNIWKQAGYYMIFYLAGLQGIPQDIYEAADLDGTDGWQRLIYITLPLLRRTTLFVLIVTFTFSFQTVEQLQALSEGGPGDSSNLLLYFVFQNISARRNWGYINAMTVILVGLIMAFTLVNFRYFEGRRADEN